MKKSFSFRQKLIRDVILLPSETKTRVIPFESLGGNGIVKGFPPDEVKIDGRKIDNNIYIGICDNVLKGDVEAIIPYELLKLTE